MQNRPPHWDSTPDPSPAIWKEKFHILFRRNEGQFSISGTEWSPVPYNGCRCGCFDLVLQDFPRSTSRGASNVLSALQALTCGLLVPPQESRDDLLCGGGNPHSQVEGPGVPRLEQGEARASIQGRAAVAVLCLSAAASCTWTGA